MADPAALWGLGGAIGGVVLAKALDYVTDRGHEDREELKADVDRLGTEVRVGMAEIRNLVADVRERVAGHESLLRTFVVGPAEAERRRSGK